VLSSKSVLILGRFFEPGKEVLNALADRVRARDMLPIVFDWEPSPQRDLTETVELLAGLCRFVLADLTEAKSVPQELSHIIGSLPSVPIQPVFLSIERPFATFEHWRRFSSVLPECQYVDRADLEAKFDQFVLKAVEELEQAKLAGSSAGLKLTGKTRRFARRLPDSNASRTALIILREPNLIRSTDAPLG
jgi:hypothetical protein